MNFLTSSRALLAEEIWQNLADESNPEARADLPVSQSQLTAVAATAIAAGLSSIGEEEEFIDKHSFHSIVNAGQAQAVIDELAAGGREMKENDYILLSNYFRTVHELEKRKRKPLGKFLVAGYTYKSYFAVPEDAVPESIRIIYDVLHYESSVTGEYKQKSAYISSEAGDGAEVPETPDFVEYHDADPFEYSDDDG